MPSPARFRHIENLIDGVVAALVLVTPKVVALRFISGAPGRPGDDGSGMTQNR